MATRGAIATMESEAQKRIETVSATLAERFGIDVPAVPFERKPEMRTLRQLETSAMFLESIHGATGGTTAKAGSPLADLASDAADDGVTLGVEETKDGTPVVVSEPKQAARKGKA